MNRLSHVTLIVEDQEKAKRWYTKHLGWKVHTDAPFGDMRWLTMHLPDDPDMEIALYLYREDDPRSCSLQSQKPGNASGWVFETNDCKKEIEKLRKAGVTILVEPTEHPWGIHAGFKDLYGNEFSLVQPAPDMP